MEATEQEAWNSESVLNSRPRAVTAPAPAAWYALSAGVSGCLVAEVNDLQ